MNQPKIEAVDFAATVDLGFAVCNWLDSDCYVYPSIVLVLVIIGGFV